jgi:hypothetical protein
MKLIQILLASLLLVNAMALPVQQMEQVLEGILVGTFGNAGQSAKACINEGEIVYTDIEAAIKDFEAGGVIDMAKALVEVGKAMKELHSMIKDCKAAEAIVGDVEMIIAELADPEILAAHIGEQMIEHGVEIITDVTNSVTDFHHSQYEKFGEDVGDLLNILFLATMGPNSIKTSVIAFVEGFFLGALKDASGTVSNCISDADNLFSEIMEIVKDLKNGVMSDLEKLFIDLINILVDIPKSVVDCAKVPKELSKLKHWVTDLKDIKAMEHKIFNAFVQYPEEIKKYATNTVIYINKGDFGHGGAYLGDFLYIIFEQVKAEADIRSAIQMLLQ